MKLSEVEGLIQSVNFETNRGFWINCMLSPCGYGNDMAIDSQIPIDADAIKGFDLNKDFCLRRIKITVELIEG